MEMRICARDVTRVLGKACHIFIFITFLKNLRRSCPIAVFDLFFLSRIPTSNNTSEAMKYQEISFCIPILNFLWWFRMVPSNFDPKIT